MDPEYRILIVEDDDADFEFLLEDLRKGGIRFTQKRTQTREEFIRAVDSFKPAIVISDYALPTFDGPSALAIVRERAPDIPFIFVSGTIGEEIAVEALKGGATDYLLKGHTKRLAQAVKRAIQEAEQRRERKRLETQLVQAQRMEAIGQLAGGVAHDFNNLLTGILGYASLALKRLPEQEPVSEDIRQIQRAGERAADLTRQLLAFSRKQIISPKVIDLNAVVDSARKLLQRLIGEDIELVTTLAPSLNRVKADASQMEQVIMNLAVNSRDAMPNGGKITIETGSVDLDETYARQHVGVKPGPYVMLAVSDTGSGMDSVTLGRLFEPFFTTKEKGKGTGLGLATVYGIVNQNGGNIWVYSEVGRGTTFKVYLPRVEQAAEAGAPEPKRAAPATGSETILLVEDDSMVRKLAAHVLKNAGYKVLEAADGLEALKVCGQAGGAIDLAITDVVMPQMGGRELAQRLKQTYPNLKILYFSGYTSDAIVRHGVLEGGLDFLQKPFTLEELTQKVRDALDRR